MALRSKAHERLEPANVNKVINLLEADEPITKKEACEILNIRYNTTRLQKIIDDYNEVWEYKEKRKSQNKGKGATRDEIKSVIEYYLDGDNLLGRDGEAATDGSHPNDLGMIRYADAYEPVLRSILRQF